jgi:hypothetical protein
MPGPSNSIQIINNDLANAIQFLLLESAVRGQFNRVEPELAYGLVATNVHVPRFVTVEAVEEKPVWARDSGDGWHARIPPDAASIFTRAVRCLQHE